VELPQYKDFVSVMTVHAAKGLEFPVVFMPGMARAARKGTERLLVSDTGGGETALGIWTDALMGDNPGYAALKKEETAEREGESKRLLYVAMTRARDHLVMMAGVKPGDDGSFKPPADTWLMLIAEAAPVSLLAGGPKLGDEAPYEYVYYPEKPSLKSQKRAGSEKTEEGRVFPPMSRLSPLPVPEGLVFRSPSALAPEEHYKDTGAGQGIPYSARLRGVLIHAALERYGRDGRLDVGTAASGLSEISGLDKKAAKALIEDVDGTLNGLFSSPAMRELLSPGPGKLFELPLMLLSGNEVVYGRADLVIIQDDTARVYDYKSGLGGMSDEEITSMYSPQLADYCEAVRGAFSLKGAEGFLLLADTGRILPLNPKNL
jgi:ATP-dependent exoDNAse (exonuclease V) beta subunit